MLVITVVSVFYTTNVCCTVGEKLLWLHNYYIHNYYLQNFELTVRLEILVFVSKYDCYYDSSKHKPFKKSDEKRMQSDVYNVNLVYLLWLRYAMMMPHSLTYILSYRLYNDFA